MSLQFDLPEFGVMYLPIHCDLDFDQYWNWHVGLQLLLRKFLLMNHGLGD